MHQLLKSKPDVLNEHSFQQIGLDHRHYFPEPILRLTAPLASVTLLKREAYEYFTLSATQTTLPRTRRTRRFLIRRRVPAL